MSNDPIMRYMDWTTTQPFGFLWFMLGIVVMAAALMVVVLPIAWGIHTFVNRGRATVTLYEDEWAATRGHYERRTTMILVGKALIPQTRRVYVVDQWTRL